MNLIKQILANIKAYRRKIRLYTTNSMIPMLIELKKPYISTVERLMIASHDEILYCDDCMVIAAHWQNNKYGNSRYVMPNTYHLYYVLDCKDSPSLVKFIMNDIQTKRNLNKQSIFFSDSYDFNYVLTFCQICKTPSELTTWGHDARFSLLIDECNTLKNMVDSIYKTKLIEYQSALKFLNDHGKIIYNSIEKDMTKELKKIRGY